MTLRTTATGDHPVKRETNSMVTHYPTAAVMANHGGSSLRDRAVTGGATRREPSRGHA